MINQTEQQFLDDLDKKLWNAADRLRSNIDAAEYKHVVLGLIFLKYVSDAFDERRVEIERQFQDPNHDYYLGDDAELLHTELETRDFYTEKNVFWVPALARWKTIQDNATLAAGTRIETKNGKTTEYEFRSINRLIDDALEAIEKENPKLKNVLDKRYAQRGVDVTILIGIINDVISKIPFQHQTLHAKDILGHVYEYFLGQFALAEGKKGGQYYTPKSIVSLIVEMLQPIKGRVYDPAMGSGGFFVQSERFIEQHQGKLGNISVYGQESNPTTWRLAAMNMAIRGIDFNFGKGPANTYSDDQHPDLRADFVMANPPFNMKEWKSGVKDDDPRWAYGIPPDGNANFAWLQHMFYHLAPNGSLGLLLANGSMSSNTNNEGEIRKKLLTEDRIECMVALPGQLFTNTQIPACIWFLTKNKKARDTANGRKLRDRSGEVLFIDARNLGYMKDRVLRDFKPEDIQQIVSTFHNWQSSPVGAPLAAPMIVVPQNVASQNESDNPVGALLAAPFNAAVAASDVTPAAPVNSGTIDDPDTGRGSDTGRSKQRPYGNIAAFCYSAKLEEIAKHDYVLTPGRYVGAAEQEDDGEPFAEKMQRLTAQLKTQFEESAKLEEQIKKNLAGLGYEL